MILSYEFFLNKYWTKNLIDNLSATETHLAENKLLLSSSYWLIGDKFIHVNFENLYRIYKNEIGKCLHVSC